MAYYYSFDTHPGFSVNDLEAPLEFVFPVYSVLSVVGN